MVSCSLVAVDFVDDCSAAERLCIQAIAAVSGATAANASATALKVLGATRSGVRGM
jgi:hypothetical protein